MPTMYSSLKSVMHFGSPTKSSVSNDMCETCHVKPKYIENGYQHPYCGRTCARNSTSFKATPCILRGCHAPGDPAQSGFCSNNHAREAVRSRQVKACAKCHLLPRSIDNVCVTCSLSPQTGPSLREVSARGTTSQSVTAEFCRAWKGNGVPKVVKVIEITLPRDEYAKYEYYRKDLRATTKVQELNTYHSCQCICDFGVNGLALCDWQSCGICCIIKSNFKKLAFGAPYNSGSYGEGIYSYQNPAQADRFATSSTSSPYRAMLFCSVVVSAPPQEMLSAASGNIISINDGQKVFVSNADAIVTRYVILYTK